MDDNNLNYPKLVKFFEISPHVIIPKKHWKLIFTLKKVHLRNTNRNIVEIN